MNEPTDEQLMSEFQPGETQAIEMIYHRYNAQVLNFCLRILGNRSQAEDVTAEVFLALFSKSYRQDPNAKFSTWLFTIARNGCISAIRKRQQTFSLWFSQKDSEEQAAYDVPDTTEGVDVSLENEEAAKQVRQAIRQLPLAQREAIVLREYHRMSYSEIAGILHCSLENTKVLIFRAREQLRGSLTSFMKEAQS